jgi:hypothetical protein
MDGTIVSDVTYKLNSLQEVQLNITLPTPLSEHLWEIPGLEGEIITKVEKREMIWVVQLAQDMQFDVAEKSFSSISTTHFFGFKCLLEEVKKDFSSFSFK